MANQQSTGNGGHLVGLGEYVRRLVTTESYCRDEIEVVFRPIGVVLEPETVFTDATPEVILSLIHTAIDEKRKSNKKTNKDGNGVSVAAIEVTRACDELSGRLEGEFTCKESATVRQDGASNGLSEFPAVRTHRYSIAHDNTGTDV